MNCEKIISAYLEKDLPHSASFNEGVTAGFMYQWNRQYIQCPYKVATAESDAFFYGREKGLDVYMAYKADFGGY